MAGTVNYSAGNSRHGHGGAPGDMPPLDRFVARHSPVTLILRDAIERCGRDRYRLVEDYRFPPMLWRMAGSLFRPVTHEVPLARFLTQDRSQVRTAMILEKVEGPSSDDLSHLELMRRLRKHLREAGRTERDSVVTLLGDTPLGASDGSRWRPTVLVVWSGDVTPLESLLGLRAMELPSTLLRSFGKQAGDVILPKAPQPSAHQRDLPEHTAPRQDVMEAPPELPTAAATPLPREATTVARLTETTVAEMAGSPDSGLRHQVIGSTRGSNYRRVLVRDMPHGKRFVLLAMDRRPGPEVEQMFFDRVGYATDAVAALRGLRGLPNQLRSFAMELMLDGSFRAVTCGVRPVFWKSAQKRMVAFPDARSADPDQPPRVIRGRLMPQDAILLLPRSAVRSEITVLEELWNSGPQALVTDASTARLDAMGFGKTLLVSKIG